MHRMMSPLLSLIIPDLIHAPHTLQSHRIRFCHSHRNRGESVFAALYVRSAHQLPSTQARRCDFSGLIAFYRSLSHIITVAPGETPRFFLEDTEISGGMDGVENLLSEWDSPTPAHVTVIIVCDEAVAVGSIQQLVDKILSHGFTCAFFGRPASDE